MSCSTNQNKISLSAVRCGISKTTNKALGLMAANKDAITIGISAGSLGFAGKLAADEFRHANQLAARKVYAQKMWDVAKLGHKAVLTPSIVNPVSLRLAQNQLDELKKSNFAGVSASMRQEFTRQHQVIDTWLKRVSSASTEDPLAREFITSAAKHAIFGMKNFDPPRPAPSSTKAALQAGTLVAAACSAFIAANKIAARRRQNASTLPRQAIDIAQKPVKNSSFVSAAGYNEPSQTLRVTFKSGQGYDYHGVPAEVAQGFLAADKKGAFFHHKIKGTYRVRRLEPPS